jgi:hypothetical protein
MEIFLSKGNTLLDGHSAPNVEESNYTTRDVELWRCSNCGQMARFPRYNDPVKLLSTRRGRCGEFANVFPRKLTHTVFCATSAGHRSDYPMGMECGGSRLGRVLLDGAAKMDPPRPV